MTLFWMVLIVVLAAAISLRPLWSRRAPAGDEIGRRALNVASYRSRLAEIDTEVAVGSIGADAAESMRQEAAARLLEDAGEPGVPTAVAGTRRSWSVAGVGIALIAAVGGLGYYLGGSRELAAWIDTARQDPAAAQRLAVGAMVRRLEQRLDKAPDDAGGWAMLGRSYYVMARYAESAAAYERANRLTAAAPNADWLADEGEVRAALGGHDLRGLPRQLFERATAIDPQQPKALWYAGLAAAQAGEYGLALDRWLALRATELPDEFRDTLDEQLGELARRAGRELPAPTAPAATAARLNVKIDVDAALAGEIAASDVLFVVARNPGGGGPPLAVQRLSAADLPTTVTLDDSNAMAPQFKLSSADRWEVVARVSRSGTAQAQSGDLEGRVTVGREDAAAPIRLRIDRRVP
ncbi:c-type cytochrome biogenesis protein CcmI [Fontimonas sp. SYSU GA230001]|uniref:c-type cytochrome biogenesis protein CcmI n=1 Tax=Fontimonas sp. SYSU GA230001 TaxID=3142450 RepID=UPI0032B57704